MGIQIYDQFSILRSTSKVKLDHTILLGFGLKELKITMNIVKVGVHTYHPNVHQNKWSNFNFEKFVKSETPSCSFAKVGVKGGENSSKGRKSWKHTCLWNGHPNLWSNFNCEKIVKSETSSCIFARFWLKVGPNSSKHCKTWCARLYIKRASKSMIKFQFSEFDQKWNSVMRFL